MTGDPAQVQEDAADARSRLLEAAVRHFADHGYAAASQRAMQRAANVNPAAAHYYFGSKEGLFRAVIDTFVHDVQQERVRRHAAIPSALRGRERLERLLLDYFTPGFAVASTPSGFHYTRILARVQGDRGGPSGSIFNEIVEPVRMRYVGSLAELFPKAPRTELREVLMMGVALMASAAVDAHDALIADPTAPERGARRIARFVAAGFEALFGPVGH